MKIRNLLIYAILPFFILTGCSSLSEYYGNLTSAERKDLIVYKTDKNYEDTQFDLILPPDLITPQSTNTLEIPEFANDKGMDIFTIDTKLDGIKIIRTGRDSYLSIESIDKEIIWKKLSDFWLREGFRLTQKDYTIGKMRTGFLENLSEAQLGTIQKYVGRYIPLLVSPETRDSYSTRLLLKSNSTDILITHYGKEYMSDGDTEFRWQNRPRDQEYESEMISRLYIYLGGEEAKSKGYAVIKSTGMRSKANMNVDENGMHTLFIDDIYERVWPEVIRSLETYGVIILQSNENEGTINVSLSESKEKDKSFIDYFVFWKSSQDSNSFNIVLLPERDGTLIEIQNDSFTNFTDTASEEVIRALYTDFR